MASRAIPRIAVVLVVGAGIACGASLKVTKIDSLVVKPANVMVLYAVETETEPVVGLAASNFRIFEDGKPVSSPDDFRVVAPDVSSRHHTLVLVDWSGRVAGTPEGAALIESVTTFAQRLRQKQRVAVEAFDASGDLRVVAPFGATDAQFKAGFDSLKDYKPTDATSDLHSAILSGGKALRTALDQSGNPVKIGALVLVARGPDRAARIKREELDAAFRKDDVAPFRRFLVGFGAEGKLTGLERWAVSGSGFAATNGELTGQLSSVAEKIEGYPKSFYFLSYCSSARAGTHELRIDVTRKVKTESGKGEIEETGSLAHKFSADGFGGGCSPKVPEDVEELTKQAAASTTSSGVPAPSSSAKP